MNLGLVEDRDRLTPLGRWLRATSLDELPTLWNVLHRGQRRRWLSTASQSARSTRSAPAATEKTRS
ncbi:sugar transferase [Micromonospora sp. NPDC005553]|uniref:sugar transferase n=1 Tax=Micromonospora sp. NPDC005553 TaxID=3364232 RepID=UPI0036A45455